MEESSAAPVSVLNCVKILAAEVRDLHSTIDLLEKKASSVSGGLQHILKIISSSESRDSCIEVDNFWYFFCCEPTVPKKLNDIMQETSDEMSDIDFWERPSWDFGEVDGSFTEQLAHLDPALGLASQLPVVPDEGSDAMLEHRAQVSLSPATTVDVATAKMLNPLSPSEAGARIEKAEDHDSTRSGSGSELYRKSSVRSVKDLAEVMRQRREACTEFESLPDGSTADVVALQPQAREVSSTDTDAPRHSYRSQRSSKCLTTNDDSWMEQSRGNCEAFTRAGQFWKKPIKAV